MDNGGCRAVSLNHADTLEYMHEAQMMVEICMVPQEKLL